MLDGRNVNVAGKGLVRHTGHRNAVSAGHREAILQTSDKDSDPCAADISRNIGNATLRSVAESHSHIRAGRGVVIDEFTVDNAHVAIQSAASQRYGSVSGNPKVMLFTNGECPSRVRVIKQCWNSKCILDCRIDNSLLLVCRCMCGNRKINYLLLTRRCINDFTVNGLPRKG